MTTEHLEKPEWRDELVLDTGAPFTVYVSGPMTGRPRFNFDAFHAASKAARWRGWVAISPAEHDLDIYPGMEQWPGFDAGDVTRCPDFDFHKAMVWDLQEVAKADGIVLLPGWESSTGAGHELDVALACGKKTFVYEPSLGGSLIDVSSQWIGERLHEQRVSADGEHRVTDPTTGGAKGSKLARFDLIPAGALYALAEHYGRGAAKYEERNWERGYAWSLSFAAMQRHAWSLWNGEDVDAEGFSHATAIAFHAFALQTFQTTHPELDDRP